MPYTNIASIDDPIYMSVNTDVSSYPEGFISIINSELGESFYNVMSTVSSFDIKGNNDEIIYTIKMSNKNENSLKQLIDMILQEVMKNNPNLMG